MLEGWFLSRKRTFGWSLLKLGESVESTCMTPDDQSSLEVFFYPEQGSVLSVLLKRVNMVRL
jgi:hypothetical protein